MNWIGLDIPWGDCQWLPLNLSHNKETKIETIEGRIWSVSMISDILWTESYRWEEIPSWYHWITRSGMPTESLMGRVKSGMFGQTFKFGQRSCLFHTSITGIRNKLTKQTVKILMRRLIRSRLIWIYTVCKCVSEFTWCPNLPDFTLTIRCIDIIL